MANRARLDRKQQEAERQAQAAETMRRAARSMALAPAGPTIWSVLGDIAAKFPDLVVRKPGDFNRSIKSKDEANLRLTAARYLYGRYPVPYHLERVWTIVKRQPHERTQRIGRMAALLEQRTSQVSQQEIDHRRYVHALAASGGSVYKLATKDYLTRKETHKFLTCPFRIDFQEAVFYALATSWSNDLGVIRRIYQSKLAQRSYRAPIWRDCVRFFCVNPVSIRELNDFVDYISHMIADTRGEYTLKGRTLATLTRDMQQWHRDLARVKRLGDHSWDGFPLPDSEIEITATSGNKARWKFSQILKSKDLAEEGNKMHHCVYSYQHRCISGRTSIWSLKTNRGNANGGYERALTIEVDNMTEQVVQIRGYANRSPHIDELQAVKRWASESGLGISSCA